MMRHIDRFINSITMYRLTLYGLLCLGAIAMGLGVFGILPFSLLSLIGSFFILSFACYFSNILFSQLLRAPANVESSVITALILFFILSPVTTLGDGILLAVIGAAAMASKYIFAIKKKHLFNPAAAGAVIAGFVAGGSAWWVSARPLLPFVAIIGFLLIRKLRRPHLLFSFLAVSLGAIIIVDLQSAGALGAAEILSRAMASGLMALFFATVMLTEPATTPPTKKLQTVYGALVGLLYGVPFHIGPIFNSPEVVLLIGNIFSYIVSSKQKLFLKWKEKKQVAEGVYHFTFEPHDRLKFSAGQYLEWTLPHPKPDSRGNRRYFTIASSPTEKDIMLGVKIMPEQSSSFKRALFGMKTEAVITASQLAGDFILPQEKNKKLAFIAGGIGVTPFRSMIRYLIDTNDKRDVVLFYTCASPADFAYLDLFKEAEQKIGLKLACIVTNPKNVPADWRGYSGYINAEIISKETPDHAERTFYLSGPSTMVDSYKKLLRGMGTDRKRIKTDYFPGF